MNRKVYKTLEYHKILSMLEARASSDKGKECCHRLQPLTNLRDIQFAQRQTADALGRILAGGSFSFGGISDPGPLGKRLAVGASANARELLAIASLLTLAGRAAAYGSKKRESLPDDSLTSRFAALDPLPGLAKEINRCILSEDSFADDASPGLRQVRRAMASVNEQVRFQLNRMLSSSARDYLQDGVITMRDGRYCLPVRAEYKNYVPGMVHDSSSSGATLFIEPMSVVNLNNELRELEGKEEEEIARILRSLSDQVLENIETIQIDFDRLAELDFIFAKGQLAADMSASQPNFNEEGIISLKAARHPLLDKNTVVPIDISLGQNYNLLVVTGPNTGGKTVSLKTCGLLTLMGQAGLHIPARDHSQLAVFDNVYADIGDEQSIEQSLSTFSSHMTNIVHILDGVDSVLSNGHDALVLFDELCAGTDPAEGAALATAILDRLHRRQIRVMATTHYSELKVYALSTDGVENASCEFSLETLSPTYRLLIGIPGKSNAFAISSKLGLAADIISDAQSRIDEESVSFEDLLADLENRRVAIEKTQAETRAAKASIDKTRIQLDQRLAQLNASKDKVLQSANLEAARILKEAKETADKTIRDFHKYGRATAADMTRMEQERRALGEKLKTRQNKSRTSAGMEQERRKAPVPKAKDLHIGDKVKVLSMGVTATVHSLPDKSGHLEVQTGIIRSRVKLTDLVLVSDQSFATLNGQQLPGTGRRRAPGSGGRQSASSFSKSAFISPEIKLLGMSGDEAICALDKYLDDAVLSHLREVRVVHGKGTGVLRQRVHEYLNGNPHVKSYDLASYGQGDAGVTVVRLLD